MESSKKSCAENSFLHSVLVPICMPADGKTFKRRLATVTGWGSLRYGGQFPSILQEAQV